MRYFIVGGAGGVLLSLLFIGSKYIAAMPDKTVKQKRATSSPVVAKPEEAVEEALPLADYEKMIYQTISAGFTRMQYEQALQKETARQVKKYNALRIQVKKLFSSGSASLQASREPGVEPKLKRSELKKLKHAIASAKQRIAILNGNGQYDRY